MIQRVILFIALFIGINSKAQTAHPPNNQAFLQDEVATIRILVSPDSLALLFHPDNLTSNHEYPATFIYESSNGTDTVTNVGFRLRGNTSRFADKKSFKVSFNSFIQGNKWNGLEKLNLNGEHNDPSILRSYLSFHLLKTSGACAPRNSYIKLFINGSYRGLYFNSEHIDEEFLQLRFPNDDDGNLYKASWGANLGYLGSNPANYVDLYELKTNTSTGNHGPLVQFITALNQTSDADFPCLIQQLFDVDQYLRALAVELLCGHWDGYAYNKNNYFLYQRPSDGKFVFIEYDMDNTFGIDWMGINWSTRPLLDWSHPTESRPLYERILSVPYFADQLSFYVGELLDSSFSNAQLNMLLVNKQDLIEPAALADNYKGLDYGFSDADFQNAIFQAWGGHVTMGLATFISNRANSASSEINFQHLNNPCPLGISDNNLDQVATIQTFNLLGQPLSYPIANTVVLQLMSDGSVRKTYLMD
jgi:hypothetical protein